MKNTQKFFIVAIVGILIIPQITFAAWWNPISWGIFSFIFHSNSPQVEMVSTTTIPSDTAVNSAIDVVKPEVVTTTKSIPTNKSTIKPSTKASATVTTTPPPAPVQTPQQTQPTGTLCNGTYWNDCPVGQNLICPTTGNAYCQIPQPPAQPVQQKDNYQICKDSYGHATWDGSSYTSSGGPNCSCDPGYGPSSDGKSCIVVQVSQPIQQPDYSINNSACQTATKNLTNFQTSYTNNYSALSGTIADNYVVQARLGIFANQYNTALPGYQMAAQAACKVPASNSQCQATLQKFDTFQAQNALSPNNTSGRSQILGNQQAMQLGNYQTDILYSCQ